MDSVFLANGLFIALAFTWMMYLAQELFVSGASALNWTLTKNDQEREAIQGVTGLYFDGIEVWLIAALTLTFGAFPEVFAQTFTFLYVIFFLLLYVLITRGVVIETLFKLDSPKWIKYNAIAWAVSSALILFLIGVYITNLFYGLAFDQTGMTKSAFSIFNVTTISGGLFYFTLGISAGAAWLKLNHVSVGSKAMRLIAKSGMAIAVPMMLLLVYMGLNVQDNSIFVNELYTESPILFVVPALSIIGAFAVLYAGLVGKQKLLFISAVITAALFVVTGFVGMFPNGLLSNIDKASNIVIYDAVTQRTSGRIIFVVILVFYPLIVSYQSWKYSRFAFKQEPTNATEVE